MTTDDKMQRFTYKWAYIPQQLPAELICLLGGPHTLVGEGPSAGELPHSSPYVGYQMVNHREHTGKGRN